LSLRILQIGRLGKGLAVGEERSGFVDGLLFGSLVRVRFVLFLVGLGARDDFEGGEDQVFIFLLTLDLKRSLNDARICGTHLLEAL